MHWLCHHPDQAAFICSICSALSAALRILDVDAEVTAGVAQPLASTCMALMPAPHWFSCPQDPLPQTVKQVHTAFGLLLDLSEECGPSALQDEAHALGVSKLHVSFASKLLQMSESSSLMGKCI